MKRAQCDHCGKEIGLWWEEYGARQQVWMHAPDDGPDAYQFCICACSDCDPQHGDIVPCCDSEEAEPLP